MRRSVLLACLTLFVFSATAAIMAEPPAHTKKIVEDSVWDAPAGGICDFHLHVEGRLEINYTEFSNGGWQWHGRYTATLTNVDTGFALEEADRWNQNFDPQSERYKWTGINWHIRTPDGGMVVVAAGEVLWDTATGEIVKITPNTSEFAMDFADVICSALGGNPAPQP
jgi:hypothetical protein